MKLVLLDAANSTANCDAAPARGTRVVFAASAHAENAPNASAAGNASAPANASGASESVPEWTARQAIVVVPHEAQSLGALGVCYSSDGAKFSAVPPLAEVLRFEDTNECVEGSHQCHNDATCHNTPGMWVSESTRGETPVPVGNKFWCVQQWPAGGRRLLANRPTAFDLLPIAGDQCLVSTRRFLGC